MITEALHNANITRGEKTDINLHNVKMLIIKSEVCNVTLLKYSLLMWKDK